MSGYFDDTEASMQALSEDGGFNTGDLAYQNADSLFITGREKDLIIINGRNVCPQDLESIAEQQPEVRTGDASAFSLPASNGKDEAVLLVQCRDPEQAKRSDLVLRIQGRIRRELGIDCNIQPVPRHTLPRTTSGKLSRSKTRKDYIRRTVSEQTANLHSLRADFQELRQAV